jgi:hypothetical protein
MGQANPRHTQKGFMRISENVAKRCLGGLTICLAATFFGVPEARAQTLPGLERSAQEAPTPTDPTSSEAIEARLTSVRDEITAVGQAVANAEPDLAEHLRRLREGLRAVETLLAQQIEALEPRPALVDEPAAGQARPGVSRCASRALRAPIRPGAVARGVGEESRCVGPSEGAARQRRATRSPPRE